MAIWEYKIVVLDLDKTARLNEAGREGWELVSVTPDTEENHETAYFKRSISTQQQWLKEFESEISSPPTTSENAEAD